MQSYIKNGILYKILQRRDEIDESIKFLTKTFVKDLPQYRGKKFRGTSFFKDPAQGVEFIKQEGLAVGAFEERTGEIAGGLLLEDRFAVPSSVLYEQIEPLFHPSAAIVEEATQELIKEGKISEQKGKYFHLFLIATSSEFRGRGIARELTGITEQLALENGYEYVISELFSKEFQNLLLGKGGYTEIKSLPFLDFEMNGEKVYESIRPYLKEEEKDLQLKIVTKKVK